MENSEDFFDFDPSTQTTEQHTTFLVKTQQHTNSNSAKENSTLKSNFAYCVSVRKHQSIVSPASLIVCTLVYRINVGPTLIILTH